MGHSEKEGSRETPFFSGTLERFIHLFYPEGLFYGFIIHSF
ncbi:hypothetical protein RUMHYD_01793 [Blautia hydrogenotrophica DSM 10507]|uniref:Uncharacterized protein n=1 Tax=Blautia hydrogenotrophica (strain DSM 10507 / JCM 14656 / S5a33) TaxID=476272 RepID=C0CLS0_BLAHS|nr:hypothetical protein RUMHYD_01793 [Blautia hydrogenotrophica DSM 10507]